MNESLVRFLWEPDEDQIQQECLYVAAENPGVHYSPKDRPTFDFRKIAEKLRPNLDAYFAGLSGKPISVEEADCFMNLCKMDFQGRNHANYSSDPSNFADHVRVICLLKHPDFMADKYSVDFLTAYAPVQPPVGFQMWMDYFSEDSFSSPRGYYLKTGFDKRHIKTMEALIRSDELWTGDKEIRRVFFSSVGELLQHLSEEQNLLLETIGPRMELLRRLEKYKTEAWVEHSPWCATAFTKAEISTLQIIAERYDVEVRKVLAEIRKERMIQHPHSC